jgi:hypothetical protein
MSLLLVVASVLTLAGVMLNLVWLTRDEPHQLSELTLRQRFAARYRRHPHVLAVQLACFAVALLVYVSDFVTLIA